VTLFTLIQKRPATKYQQFIGGGKPVMTLDHTVRIGDWFKNTNGDSFEVVARDESDETIELQYFDGTIEELDRETWEEMHPDPIEPPEDWTGSMDLAREDYQSPESVLELDDWMSELDRMDKQ